MLNNKKMLLITLVCAGLSTNLMLTNGDTVAADATVAATAPSFDPAAKPVRTATPPAAQPVPTATEAPQAGAPMLFDPATKPAVTATAAQASQVQPQMGMPMTEPTKATAQPIAAPVAPTAPAISASPQPESHIKEVALAVVPSTPPATAAPQMGVAPMAPGFPMAFGHPMAYGYGKHTKKMYKKMSKSPFKHYKNPLKFAKRTFICRLLGLPTPQAQMAMQQHMVMGSFHTGCAAPAMIAVR